MKKIKKEPKSDFNLCPYTTVTFSKLFKPYLTEHPILSRFTDVHRLHTATMNTLGNTDVINFFRIRNSQPLPTTKNTKVNENFNPKDYRMFMKKMVCSYEKGISYLVLSYLRGLPLEYIRNRKFPF